MKLSDLPRARAVAGCLEDIKKFEEALKGDEVVYLKLFRTHGSEGDDDPEYHLGGHPIAAELIQNERKRLEAKALELGLDLQS